MKQAIPQWVAAALLAGLCAAAQSGGAEDERPRKVFVGYLYGKPREINFKLYTHLCHAFLVADADGRVKPAHGVPDAGLTADAHRAGVKVLVSLGGWGYDEQFAAMVAKPAAEERYVRSVLQMVDAANYDGVDLDWEYPDTKAEVAGFEHLTRRLRRELDALAKQKGRPMLLTMAASSNPGTLSWLGRDLLLETMDWINVMTYDFAGDWTDYAGHHSPLFASPKQPGGRPVSSADTIRYLIDERRLPPDRLALGIPLYGRAFAVSAPYLSTGSAPKRRMPQGEYSNLERLMREQHWVRTWDDATKTPWLSAPDHSVVIGYDDPESVAIKTEWAMKQGLRGVFFWQIDGDRLPDGSNPVQQAVRHALNQAIANAKPAR